LTESDSRISGPSAQASTTIGRYQIVKLLGKGSMGAVLQAHDPVLDRDVAIKVMLPQIGADPEQRLRLEREARAIARMMHPNVVTVFDLGYLPDGSPYIAMELLRGRDLFQTLTQGPPLEPDQKLSVILQILDGLGHAHRAGIVHRDIKPANTFLSEDGTVKIMDFGVAHFNAASMTSTGVVVGTANYMSPEQVSGSRVDGRADLFSVGCMLYELALGRRPFQADSVMTTLWKIVQEEPSYDPETTELGGLRTVLRRALAKKPVDRFQTAAEFMAALRALVASGQAAILGGAGASSIPPRTAEPPTAAVREPLPAHEPARPPTDTAPPPADPAPLFALMRDIQKRAKSGHLHFSHGGGRRSLLVRRGGIVHGTSDLVGQHLGDILVRYGFLAQIDLERAAPLALRDRRRLGDFLVEKGLVRRAMVQEAVEIQIREILAETTDRSDGRFDFEERFLPEAEDASSSYPMGQMILEAARRIQSPEIVNRALGERSRTVSLSTHPVLRSQQLALTPTEGFLLSRIDGTTSAAEALALVPLPVEDVERSLFALLSTGLVEYVATESVGARPRPPAAPPTPATRETPAATDRLRGAARAAEQRAASVREAIAARLAGDARRREICEAHEALGQKSHFEVLGVDPGCSTGEVEAAFRRLALTFHPDVPLDPSLSDLRDKRAEVYARLLEAYEVLVDLDRRSEYRARHEPKKTSASPPDAAGVPPVVSIPIEGPLDPELAAEKIREAAQLLRAERNWDAIQLLQSILTKAAGHNRFRAQVLLARAYLKNPKWTKRAEDLLHQVVQEAPDHAEAYVVLGNVYRGSELKTRAVAMYRRALSLQPAHPEAVEGLEQLEPAPADPGRGTFMSKLFSRTGREP
jgi:Protein kinase domain/DnaJ domain/Domain of unknown function (DUF4388)